MFYLQFCHYYGIVQNLVKKKAAFLERFVFQKRAKTWSLCECELILISSIQSPILIIEKHSQLIQTIPSTTFFSYSAVRVKNEWVWIFCSYYDVWFHQCYKKRSYFQSGDRSVLGDIYLSVLSNWFAMEKSRSRLMRNSSNFIFTITSGFVPPPLRYLNIPGQGKCRAQRCFGDPGCHAVCVTHWGGAVVAVTQRRGALLLQGQGAVHVVLIALTPVICWQSRPWFTRVLFHRKADPTFNNILPWQGEHSPDTCRARRPLRNRLV